ncbi:MAG: DUF4105 domain-containing protein [Gemmatimonadaceae bacterium]|nr:DUF4105 domain-containing protein [Gemmatimonadaceae bacterium]
MAHWRAVGATLARTVAPLVLLASALVAQVPDNVPRTPRPPAPGTSPALDSARAERGKSLTFAIYTYGPGDEVFERFGHIALAMADASTGEDVAFNWGMFDFNQPNFLGRFLTGDTRYWMEGYRTFAFNAAYQGQNRSIRKQVLSLTNTQKGALQEFLLWNVQEDNKYYRYDYYNDNCSTRVRDAIDWALGGALKPVLDTAETHYTWRGETARITGDNLPIYAGIEVALGQQADRHLSKWQSDFLPERLATDFAGVTLRDGTKLIAQDTVLFAAASRTPLLREPPQWRWRALIAGLVLALAVFFAERRLGARGVVTAFGTLWYVVGGILGMALLLAGTVTKHAPYMGSNLSLFQVQPLLLLTGLLWWARGRSSRAGRAATWLAMLSAVIAFVGLLAQHLPMLFHQHNDVVWMFMAPVTVALGYAALPPRSGPGRV